MIWGAESRQVYEAKSSWWQKWNLYNFASFTCCLPPTSPAVKDCLILFSWSLSPSLYFFPSTIQWVPLIIRQSYPGVQEAGFCQNHQFFSLSSELHIQTNAGKTHLHENKEPGWPVIKQLRGDYSRARSLRLFLCHSGTFFGLSHTHACTNTCTHKDCHSFNRKLWIICSESPQLSRFQLAW